MRIYQNINTHSLPADASGGLVYYTDTKNENKPQYIMTEKGVIIPTEATNFKEKTVVSEYVQQYPHTGNIINQVSNESNTKSKILNRTLRKINGIPTDVEL